VIFSVLAAKNKTASHNFSANTRMLLGKAIFIYGVSDAKKRYI